MYECVAQYGSRAVGLGGLRGFSRICSDVGVEPKYSDGIIEVLCCESSVGVSSKEIRVDVWGFWVVVGIAGFSWDDVGED